MILSIECASRSLSSITIKRDILQSLGAILPQHHAYGIITDDRVACLYGETVRNALEACGRRACLFSFPRGEQHKTRATKELLEDKLCAEGFDRGTCIVGLGGGVVSDLAGFVAATYMRGIPLYLVPTTLLGMVDASIGGKNGVNLPSGKNAIGSIYLPESTWIDPSCLKSLPPMEFQQGVVETIKHGLISNPTLFEQVEGGFPMHLLDTIIHQSCKVKVDLVNLGIADSGRRHLLNFGHTFGHALETLSDYTIVHGQAVALGIVAEAFISRQLRLLSMQSFDRIKRSLTPYFPSSIPRCSVDRWYLSLSRDKKSSRGIPHVVLLKEIGVPLFSKGLWVHPIKTCLIHQTIEWIDQCYAE